MTRKHHQTPIEPSSYDLAVETDLPATIPQLVLIAANKYGDQSFLESDSKDGKKERISFKEFSLLAQKVGAALIARGVRHSDRVAIWAPNINAWPIAALGAQFAGAVLVPLNTRFKTAEASYVLRQSGAKILFSIGEFLDVDYPALLADQDLPELQEIITFNESREPHTRWQDFLKQAQVEANQIEDIKADSISDILFTSGTTGAPKGVMTSHQQNLKVFSYWSGLMGFGIGDRYLVVNPFFHSFGYKAGILACLLRGCTLLPHAVFDSAQILRRIANDSVTVLPGPPTLFQSLLTDKDLHKHDISSLRFTATGAASIPVTLIQQMKSQLGFERVITAYGLTESCGVVTMCRPEDSAETIALTSGRAIADTQVRCVDADNKEVPAGSSGEIVVKGYNVMQGYFENDVATKEAIDPDGWLHTGDVGVLDESGNLRITDRINDVYISGGFNCYPAEIEKLFSEHPDIAMCAVIGVADQRMGEVGLAFVVLNENSKISSAELLDWGKEQMANYKVPREIRIIQALPLNASGKVVKPTLRELLLSEN